MLGANKNIRYYYWLSIEFVRKYLRLIFLSALISTITIISAMTISPYLVTFLTPHTTVVGMVGTYTLQTLPDDIVGKISNGLLYINDKGKITPVLAESWEMLDNGLTYRFHLKKNILLDDNTFFTAKDVSYRFKDVQIKTVGDYVIEFRLSKPLAIFPTYLTKPIVKYPYYGIGGLYKVERIRYKYDNIEEINLSPNKKDLPSMDYKFYANESMMINAYKLGDINQMQVTKKSLADIFKSWKNTKVIKSVDYSNLLTIFFNFRNRLLQEKEVRSAIKMSVDRSLFKDIGVSAKSSIPPVSWAYNSDLKDPVYDTDTATKIIKKYKTASESAKLNFNTYYDYLDMASNINKSFNDIGISTNLNVISYSNANDFDLLLAFLKIPADPDQYYYWHSTQNLSKLTGYKNLKLDKLLEDGRSSFEQDARVKSYMDFQKTFDEDNGAVFLYFPYIYTIERK